MIKKIAKFKGIFIFAALFLIFSNITLASNVETFTEEAVLQQIMNNSSVSVHARYSTEGNQKAFLESEYALEVNLDDGYYDEGTIYIGGNRYLLELVVMQNGEEYDSISDVYGTLAKTEVDGRDVYVQYLDLELYGKPSTFDDLDVKYRLIRLDADGNIDANAEEISQIGSLNIQTDAKGNYVEKEVNNFERATKWRAILGVLRFDFEELGKLITETLTGLIIPTGDGILHMISTAVGEPVSIDKAVYGEVKKLDIDFFNTSEVDLNAELGLDTPLKNIISNVVNTWYSVFQGLALIVYMILLVYIGIKILLSSTGDKKAMYKGLFSTWVTGVAMLLLFPTVMSLAIKINDAFCLMVGQGATTIYGSTPEADGRVDATYPVDTGLLTASQYYGTDKFVMMMLNSSMSISDFNANAIKDNLFGKNAMMRVRYMASKTLDLPLAIIYIVLIGQLLAILILYYKRVFMIGFLITIFPIVAMFYPLSKIGDIKIKPFSLWFKEFLVNVFVQTFHAVTYTVVVTVGVNTYLSNDNWFFMIICVLFLFEGEKIIRAIFNLNSSMNTIGDMAAAGAMAWNITKSVGGLFGGKDKGKDSSESEKDPEKKADADLAKVPKKSWNKPGLNTPGAEKNMMGIDGASGASGIAGAVSGGAGDARTGIASQSVELGRKSPKYPTGIYNSVDKKYKERIKASKKTVASKIGNVAGKGLNIAGQSIGGMAGLTLGMAQTDNKSGANPAISGLIAGQAVGKEITSGINSIVGTVHEHYSGKHAGRDIANEYLSGKHDDEFGVREADEDLKKKKIEAYRKIAAEVARRSPKSSTSAETYFINSISEEIRKDKP